VQKVWNTEGYKPLSSDGQYVYSTDTSIGSESMKTLFTEAEIEEAMREYERIEKWIADWVKGQLRCLERGTSDHE